MTIFLLLCNAPTVFSQNRYTITKSFTINNGLPSNNVYRCVQDNKGFLWVATDAGIARFDGKQFQVFTTQHGLPDNEVLEVIKENNGTIWVICFKQSPAYFDEVENRFINANEKKYLQNIYSTSSIYGYPLIKGGMKFITEQGSFIVKNNKLETFLPYKGNFLLLDENGNDKVYWGLRQAYSKNKTVKGILLWVKNDKAIDSFELIKRSPTSNFNYGADGTSFYFNYPAEKYVIVVDSITVNTTMVKRRLLKVAESFFKSSATTNYLAFSSNAGNVHVYNKQNLKFEFTLNGNYIPNTIYEDNSNNIWVCSLDKGLILYKKQTIKQVDLPSSFQNLHFISLALKSNGSILAGNYYGELIEKNKQNFRVYKPTSTKTITRIRKIIFSQNKAFTFSEQGIFVNNKNRITSKKISYVFAKTALQINDSIVLVGIHNGLQKLNTITNEIERLYTTGCRITALAKMNDSIIYFGSLDGLYKYNIKSNSHISLASKHILLKERVMSVAVSADKIVWVATSSNGVIAVKNDEVVEHFSVKKGLISNSTRCITTAENKEVWIGTFEGLSKVSYQLNRNKVRYTIQNFTENDGLSSNVFNELLFHNDTIYAATANGISILPTSFKMPKFDIPIHLIAIKINQHDTIIAKKYSLAAHQKNIELQFAGVELNGHFKNLQYKIDNEKWIELANTILNLQLVNGRHQLQVRAVDVNGNISTNVFNLFVEVATPFFKTFWFWLILLSLISALIVFVIVKYNKQKSEQKLLTLQNNQRLVQIEMQAIKAQINPHFIFNCLNSIKSLNFQQRYKEADDYTDKFSELLRNVLDYSGEQTITLEKELQYIKNYVALEQLRFGDKLQFNICIHSSLNISSIQIPALLLQPYVENAIKHGIGNLIDKEGKLKIDIDTQNEKLRIRISDNGVGVAYANSLNSINQPRHISKGMYLTNKRNELYAIETKIEDLRLQNGEINGTLVTLII